MVRRHTPQEIKFIVGIDEAGRGPLAGPVAVGAVVFNIKDVSGRKKHALLAIARDSKQLSALRREEIYKKMHAARKAGEFDSSVVLVSSAVIDKKGIVHAIRKAVQRTLQNLAVPPHQTLVLLDGSLRAPDHFLFQETIIRGDQSEPVIGLASIAAKVTRDNHMIKLAQKYPQYGFEVHKGYGTLLHRQKIKKYGPSEVHRRSFLGSQKRNIKAIDMSNK